VSDEIEQQHADRDGCAGQQIVNPQQAYADEHQDQADQVA